MNKLTKIGVSALCGSLAAVSAANAGSMSVAGGATMTYTQVEGTVTGNPLGMASNLTFTGSGELDSGVGVTLTVTHGDKNSYSSSSVAADVPGLGKFTFDQGGGTGLDRIDDMMPTAWEESYDTGTGAALRSVTGAGGSTDIEWAISADLLPAGMSTYIAWSPKPDGTAASDKTEGGATHVVTGHGWDMVVMYDNPLGLVEGLNLFGGYSLIEQAADDRESYGFGAKYAVGGLTLGYQQTTDSNPTVGSKIDAYDNQAFGVSFNVNDNLSVSYGVHKSTQEIIGNTNVDLETKSAQIAYTLGGAAIKIAETDVENKAYGTTDMNGTLIGVTLAF